MDALFEALIGAVLEPLAHLLGELLSPWLELLGEALAAAFGGLCESFVEWMLGFLLQILVVPTVCILSTPFVLLDACFGPGRYLGKVANHYQDLRSCVQWS